MLDGEQSVELDFEEAEKEILNELLSDFKELLKIPYRSIGYLVRSDSNLLIASNDICIASSMPFFTRS